jgi:gentisate 1,2-dioxygenase
VFCNSKYFASSVLAENAEKARNSPSIPLRFQKLSPVLGGLAELRAASPTLGFYTQPYGVFSPVLGGVASPTLGVFLQFLGGVTGPFPSIP